MEGHSHSHSHGHHDDKAMMSHAEFEQHAHNWFEDPLVEQLNCWMSEALLPLLQLTGQEHVLDMGCGAGNLSSTLITHCASLTGVDVSAAMIAQYKQRLPLAEAHCLLLTGLDQGPLRGKRYNRIVCAFALHHMTSPAEVVKLLAAYLAPGGSLYFGECYGSEPNSPFFKPGVVQQWLTDAALSGAAEQTVIDFSQTPLPESQLSGKSGHQDSPTMRWSHMYIAHGRKPLSAAAIAASEEQIATWKAMLREIPDFPKIGIRFQDIEPLLTNAAVFRGIVWAMCAPWVGDDVQLVVGPEARGFIFSAAMAMQLGCGVALLRKPGKLPATKVGQDYGLEYGVNRIEMHLGTVKPGQKVLIVDDLLATGGTVEAAVLLVQKLGGIVSGVGFLVELLDLEGRKKLEALGLKVQSVIKM